MKKKLQPTILDTVKSEESLIKLMFDLYPLDKVTWLPSIYRAEAYSREVDEKNSLSEYNISNLCKNGLIGFKKDEKSPANVVRGQVAKEHIKWWTAISQGFQVLIDKGIVEKIAGTEYKLNLNYNPGGVRNTQQNKLHSIIIHFTQVLKGLSKDDLSKCLEILTLEISENS
ncbi:MAG: hypothetical protein ACRCZ2_05215 [Fusobacteriaceae bacterium]